MVHFRDRVSVAEVDSMEDARVSAKAKDEAIVAELEEFLHLIQQHELSFSALITVKLT